MLDGVCEAGRFNCMHARTPLRHALLAAGAGKAEVGLRSRLVDRPVCRYTLEVWAYIPPP